MMFEKIDLPAGKAGKKSLLYLGVVLATAILVWAGVSYYSSQIPEKEIEEEISEKSEKEKMIKQQLKELEEKPGSLSGEEIKKQLKELEALR